MNWFHESAQAITRRHFFGNSGLGLGAIALQQLLAGDRVRPARAADSESRSAPAATDGVVNPLAPKPTHFPAKAKAVIYLHMAGSPSQLDLFDYKPTLIKHSGQPCPKEFLEGKRFAFIRGVPNMLGSPFQFAQHGPNGAWLSSVWKHLPKVLGEVAIVKTMHTEQFNHAPAQLFLHTGTMLLGGASMGAWATYGLGSESQDLPGFVVLTSGGKTPDAGTSVWGSGYLPTVYQGVQCRTQGDPVLYLSNPPGLDTKGRRQTLDTLKALNEMQSREIGDPETLTRIAQYELAYRMQTSVPEAMDISKEPQHIHELYGSLPGHTQDELDKATDVRTVYKGDDPTFANNCLLARRLVERGVRFVQLFDWGWDHHGASPGESIDQTLPIKAQQIDRALTGLILDLKQRGLLDSTLIVWGGEFGRTPMAQTVPKEGFF
ncbi:MAG: DUF1501 domain-containing protein, partial [Planctomycetota bacterium]|nr:DUF1501 domain-containing protein [Planctomycetota bacterium]